MQELEKILEEIDQYIMAYRRAPYGIEVEGTVELLERCRDAICNHLNDGWIPTKERMPTKEECEMDNIRFLISIGIDCWYSTEIAKCSWVEVDNVDGTDGSYSEFWIDQFPHIYYPSQRLIAAWKILELPEPYIPRKEQ